MICLNFIRLSDYHFIGKFIGKIKMSIKLFPTLINQLLYGFLVFDCIKNKCVILTNYYIFGFSEPSSIIGLIIAWKLLSVNWQIYRLWHFIRQTRFAPSQIRNSHQQPTAQSPDVLNYRIRLQNDIRDIGIEHKIGDIWITLIEAILFIAACFAPQHTTELVLVGAGMSTYHLIN